MSRTATARQPRQNRESKIQPRAIIEPDSEPEVAPEYDLWEASSVSIDLLIRCLQVYTTNEGHWSRPRIQRDLLRAAQAISPHLRRKETKTGNQRAS